MGVFFFPFFSFHFHSIAHSTFFIPFSIISSVFPEDKNQIVKRYVYSGTSGAASLQQFVEQNIYHRQGEVHFCTLDNFFQDVTYIYTNKI